MTLSVPSLHVAAGVLRAADGRVLIARRPDHVHQGGLWEFPGGKRETDESIENALVRELEEELHIRVRSAQPLITLAHAYPDRHVLLDVWEVTAWEGEPWGREGQPVRWVWPDELPAYDFPAANMPIVTAARLPEHYAIIDMSNPAPARLEHALSQLSRRGVRLVQLRGKALEAREFRHLATRAVDETRRLGLRLLLNSAPELALELGADGVHLTAIRLAALERRPLPSDLWVAASCHCPEELQLAWKIGADFAVFGPVQVTATHPLAAPVGWTGFAQACRTVPLPVYALGGMTLDDVAQARIAGGRGIAAIRAFAAAP